MGELIVVTKPLHMINHETGFEFETDEVVGILDGSKTLIKYGYKLDGTEREETTGINGEPTNRIVEAFKRSRGFNEQHPVTRINCHLFVFFALSKVRELEGNGWIPIATRPIGTDETQTGTPYSTVTSEGVLTHTLLGTSSSRKGLSVLGNGGPLVICDNADLVIAYEADILSEVNLD